MSNKIMNGAKRIAKYTFVEMPLAMIGWRQFKANNGYLRDLWHTLSNPHCPECGKGVMCIPHDAEPDNKALYPWTCSAKCGFGVFAPKHAAAINEIIAFRNEQRGKQRLAFLDDPTRSKLIRSHLRKSRGYWFAAALVFAMFAWQLAKGAPWMVVFSVLSLALPFSIHAIRWNYRAWQIRTGTLFVPGAFQHFVRDFLWVRGGQ